MASNDYPGQLPLEENSVWRIQAKSNGSWKMFDNNVEVLRGAALDRRDMLREMYPGYQFRLVRITTAIYADGEP